MGRVVLPSHGHIWHSASCLIQTYLDASYFENFNNVKMKDTGISDKSNLYWCSASINDLIAPRIPATSLVQAIATCMRRL